MAQDALQRRRQQKALARKVRSGTLEKSSIGRASARAAEKARAMFGSSSGEHASHALGSQFGNSSGSTTLVGGPSKGRHAGSYNHAKDVSAVARTGDTAMGRHAKGGPMSTVK